VVNTTVIVIVVRYMLTHTLNTFLHILCPHFCFISRTEIFN